MTATGGRGVHDDQPEVREEDAWWVEGRAVVSPVAEAPPVPVAGPPRPVEPAATPSAPIAPSPQPSLPDTLDPGVVAPARMPPRRTRTPPRSGGSRRRALVAGALALALFGLVAVLVVQRDNDAPEVATEDATSPGAVTTAAPTTTAGASGGGSNGESVTVKTDVLFDVGSSQLTDAASSRLENVLSLAQADPSRSLLIEGFTDGDGDRAFNRQLSEARAQAVAEWLIGQGIDPGRISVVGHGEDNPIAPNDTPENKALNRRVVVVLQT